MHGIPVHSIAIWYRYHGSGYRYHWIGLDWKADTHALVADLSTPEQETGSLTRPGAIVERAGGGRAVADGRLSRSGAGVR